MTTTRKITAAALLMALSFTAGYLGHNALAQPTPAPPAPALVVPQNVIVDEDGSGVQYDGTDVVRTFPTDTFVWNCQTMGNHRCGTEN